MADNIRDYLEALKEFESCKQRVVKIINTVRGLAESLRHNPSHFSFANSGIGYAAKSTFSNVKHDARDWPSARRKSGRTISNGTARNRRSITIGSVFQKLIGWAKHASAS